MNKSKGPNKSNTSVVNDDLDNKIKYINVFSKFHIQYVQILNILKSMISKLNNYSTLSPQEILCLLQIQDVNSKKYSGDTGLKNLAKRTNHVADHLMFQLNNLARKNLVNIEPTQISLTNEGEYIVNAIASQISIPTMRGIDHNLTSIQKQFANIII